MTFGVGKAGRAMILHLAPDDDFFECIIRACKEANFEHAAMTTCIGSLKKINYSYAERSNESPFGLAYLTRRTYEGAIQIISIEGVICKGENGEYLPHFHVCFITDDGETRSGHIFDEGTPVFSTMEICLQEVAEITVDRRMDSYYKVPILYAGVKEGSGNVSRNG